MKSSSSCHSRQDEMVKNETISGFCAVKWLPDYSLWRLSVVTVESSTEWNRTFYFTVESVRHFLRQAKVNRFVIVKVLRIRITLIRIRIPIFDADPNPNFHFNADPIWLFPLMRGSRIQILFLIEVMPICDHRLMRIRIHLFRDSQY